jgi:hypothetical protein
MTLLATGAFASSAAAATTVTNLKFTDAGTASVTSFDPATGTTTAVSVTREVGGGPASNFLFHSSQRCTTEGAITTCETISGQGSIPKNAFQVNAKSADLLVDTSQVEGFVTTRTVSTFDSDCAANPPGGDPSVCFTSTTTDATGGLIDLSFVGTDTVRTSQREVQEPAEGITVTIKGQMTVTTATVTGTVLGTPVNAEDGTITRGKNMFLIVERSL